MAVKTGRGLSSLMKGLSNQRLVPHMLRFFSEGHTFKWTTKMAPKPKDDYFHPSGDCTKCIRLMFFERHPDYKKLLKGNGFTPELLAIMDHGNVLHDWLQAVMLKMAKLPNYPKLHEAEVPLFDEDLWVKGHADGVVELIDGNTVLLEIKTVNSYKYNSLKSPMIQWITQVQVYLHMMGLNEGIVLVFNREDCKMKEFSIKYNPEIVKDIFARWDSVRSYLASDTVPPLHSAVDSLLDCKPEKCRAGGFCLGLDEVDVG